MKHYNTSNYNRYLKDLKMVSDPQLQYFLRIAADMARSYPREEARAGVNTLMDIVQNANVGLSEALNNLNEDKSEGEKVSYIKQWIDTRIKRYVFSTMSDVKISEYAIQKSKAEKLADLFVQNFVYSNKMFNWKLRIKFDDFYPGTNLRYSDIVEDRGSSRWHETVLLGETLKDAMVNSGLTEKQIDILGWSYGLDEYDKLSIKEIAKTLRMSEIGIKVSKRKALEALDTEENRELLKNFL